jgi:hypothetical protein
VPAIYGFQWIVGGETNNPINGSWTGASVHFAGFLARPRLANTDDAGFTLLGRTTQPGDCKVCNRNALIHWAKSARIDVPTLVRSPQV